MSKSKSQKVTAPIFENDVTPGEVRPLPMKKIVKVQFDIEYGGDPGKTMDGSTDTVPDMHLTVRQLLENHTRGIDDTTQVRQPFYFDTEIPTINDITDVEAFKASLESRLEQVNQFIQEEHKVSQNEEKEVQTASDETPPQE